MARTKLVARILLAEEGFYHAVGAIFEAHEERAAVLVGAGVASPLDAVSDPDEDSEIEKRTEQEVDAGDGTIVEWPIRNMTAEQYLERYPNGPRAAIASIVIAQTAAAAAAAGAETTSEE